MVLRAVFTGPGFLGAFAGVFGMIFFAISNASGQTSTALEQSAVEGLAIVREKKVERSSRFGGGSSNAPTYIVRYDFAAQNAKVYRGKSGVPEARWRSLSTGDRIAVYYLPSDPNVSEIWLERPQMESVVTGRIAMFAFLFAAAGLGWGFAKTVRS
ncbi:MAG: hypothetical protein AAFR13_07940 [Pseudomonadota bacterium]